MKTFKEWLETAEPFVVDYDVNQLIDTLLDEFPISRKDLSQMVHDLLIKNSHLTKSGMLKLLKLKIKNWLSDWSSGHSGRPPWASKEMPQINTEN